MERKSTFIAVGENIHCTRIFKVGGKYAKTLEDGRSVITYQEHNREYELSVPETFVESEDWRSGKVKHAAVAIWHILYGDSTGKEAGEAYLEYMARRQEAAGASFLDINVDEFGKDVPERIRAIETTAGVVQRASQLPLSVDSSNIEILKAGLQACDRLRGRPMVNSVSLERSNVIGVAREAEAVVVANAGGETAMPADKEERVNNIKRLMDRLTDAGFERSQIYLDPLVFPISVDQNNGLFLMEAIKDLRDLYGAAIHFAPGLSNISFGMPNRKLLNQVFTYLCMQYGLDGGIVDPMQISGATLKALDPTSEPFKLAQAVLTAQDPFGMDYITAAREGKL